MLLWAKRMVLPLAVIIPSIIEAWESLSAIIKLLGVAKASMVPEFAAKPESKNNALL